VAGTSVAGISASDGHEPVSAEAGDFACEPKEAVPAPVPGPALVLGLGNPGGEYANHRHNIGFRVLDELASAHDLSFHRVKWARAREAKGEIGGRMVILAKPQTFMNLSGRAAGRLSRHYEISPGRILVVYDDLDLPLGRLRLRAQGGAGGHKGMRSIIETLGTQAFPRLRVGIDRPPGGLDPAEYVLQPFREQEAIQVGQVVERASAAIECWLEQGIEVAMDQYNRPPADAHQDAWQGDSV
jgi:PTH1 family peptidyl-tRNA hydrolase